MIDVPALAQKAMNNAGGDVVEATDILEKLARNDTKIWKAVTDQLLREACYNHCRAICRTERRAIWYSDGYDSGGNGGRVKTHSNSMLDWPLPGGKPIRHADKHDLLAAADFYKKQAENMEIVSLWLTAVASKVATKTVGEKLTDKQLRDLQSAVRETRGAITAPDQPSDS